MNRWPKAWNAKPPGNTPRRLCIRQLQNGHRLWVAQNDDGEPVSFVTTFITPDGSGRNVGVMLAGVGEKGKIDDWRDAMEGAIANWFSEQGCHQVGVCRPARLGKAFPAIPREKLVI